MVAWRKQLQAVVGVVGALLLTIAFYACSPGPRSQTPPSPNGSLAPLESLAEVAPLPDPELPDWIDSISPTGDVEPLSQVRIRFENPLIPLERLDSPGQQEILDRFKLSPDIPGEFRFLTPRMVGFQGDRALSKATRFQVSLGAGLGDLEGNELTEELNWTFETEEIVLSRLPDNRNPSDIEPQFEIQSNVQLDLDSLASATSLFSENDERTVPVTVAPKEQYPYTDPSEQFDASQRRWSYVVEPRETLRTSTSYQLEFAAGLEPEYGNLPSEDAFASSISTYDPLAFQELKMIGLPGSGGAYGRFDEGSPRLVFNNRLEYETARDHVTISPAPEGERVDALDSGWDFIDINPYTLEPNTDYQITIDAELTDIYGQTLGAPVTLDYHSSDVAAAFSAPEGLNVFPAEQNLQLDIASVNLPEGEFLAAYEEISPVDLAYTDSAYAGTDEEAVLPPRDRWQPVAVPNTPNEVDTTAVPLRDRLGKNTGMLAYGVRAKVNQYERSDRETAWWEPEFFGLVQLTDLGVFAQVFPESAMVQVHHLSDGSVAPAQVSFYESQLYRDEDERTPKSQLTPCATGTTDEEGVLTLNASQLQGCMEGTSVFEDPPELLVVAEEGEDWAFTRLWRYSGAWGYGLWSQWESGEPVSRGTIFSDRQLYQPGEEAEFTGVAYFLQNGELTRNSGGEFAVELRGPDGETQSLGQVTTNQFGTFNVPLDLDDRQPLGFYSIQAEGENGALLTGSFRVAEFKPPNFKVDVALDSERAYPGDEVSGDINSQYLFGAPVDGGQVRYFVSRSRAYFTPEGWEDFQFGRGWYWPEEEPTVSSEVLQVDGVLDAAGDGMQSFEIAEDLPYPMTYRFEAEVSDVSNLSVAGNQTILALPEDRLIGLSGDFLGQAEEAFEVEVIVTDPDGEPLRGQSVELQLQKIEYRTVTQSIEGSEVARNQAEYTTVDEVTVRSGTEAQVVELTPTEGGSYRIRANFANASGDTTATDLRLWVTGFEPIFWGDRGDRLDVRLDKDQYEIGDTATALIQSPYAEADLYVAVIRHDTIYSVKQHVTGGAPQVQFPVTEEMLPNAAIQAVLVRQGEDLSELEPDSVEALSRVGFASFTTDLGDRYLDIDVSPLEERVGPGEEQTVQFQVSDRQGNPVEAQLTVMVVNEAILQLNGYRPPDLVATVFAEQPISTRFSDNRPEVELESPAAAFSKGWGFGGGLSVAGSSTRVRREFRPLAAYEASILTDENGEAEMAFTLPDDLTTWRVMGVAASEEMQFGNGEATFIATQPLLSNPILPQFARLGDRFKIGVAVTNTTGTDEGDYTITSLLGDSEGAESLPIQFADGGAEATLDADVEEPTQGFRFDVTADQVGTAQILFETRLEDDGTEVAADAFEVPLEVRQLTVTEQVVETGATEDRVEIPVRVDETVLPTMGGLSVTVASSLLPPVIAAMEPSLPEDWLPCLEPAASRLEMAAHLKQLQFRYGQVLPDFDGEAIAADALTVLTDLQQPDGGFEFWPGIGGSSSYYSPYAAVSLAIADAAGLEVDDRMVDRLKTYLSNQLADPGGRGRCDSLSCRNRIRLDSLLGLAALGDVRTTYLSDLYEWRENFSFTQQVRLARYLRLFPQWQTESVEMADQLQEVAYETGRTATVNLPNGWSWIDSQAVAQSELLQLWVDEVSFGDRPIEQAGRALTALLSLRREDGLWRNRYDTVNALRGLTAYSGLESTPPSFTAQVNLADTQVLSTRFDGYDNPHRGEQVQMSELPVGDSVLELSKSGDGTLHYRTAYSYRLPGNRPGQLNGLRVTREVRPANQPEVLQRMGLVAPEEDLSVAPGQVFDIGLEIIADHPVTHMVIEDPLPAGFEAIDTSFQTSTPYFQASRDSWEIDLQTIHKDGVTAYADYLDAGVYEMHYLVRSVTPGVFEWPGAHVYLDYAPEEFGRSASTRVEVGG